MSTPWIQVYSNLPTHRKTGVFADCLGISGSIVNPNTIAAGLLVSLWAWAIQNAYDGDLSNCSARCIAEACGWRKKPETIVQALLKSGYLDADMKLHDWEEYAVLFLDGEDNRRAKTRERVANYRARKRAEGNACNASTIPNHTIPNITVPITDEERKDRKKENDDVFMSEAEFLSSIQRAKDSFSNPETAQRVINRICEHAEREGYHIDPDKMEVTRI